MSAEAPNNTSIDAASSNLSRNHDHNAEENLNKEQLPLRTLVEQALELEEIDVDLYRSKRLWTPIGSRGTFGGQIVGLALSAATKTVDQSKFHVHSLHSYFLAPGDFSIPLLYQVIRVKNGNSYVVRSVTCRQRGKIVFEMIASFHAPEQGLEYQYTMPIVPPPDLVPSEEAKVKALLTDPRTAKCFHNYLKEALKQPIPVELKRINHSYFEKSDVPPEPRQRVWMRAKGKLPDDLAFHHIVAAYCSDHYLLFTSLNVHQVTAYSSPVRLQMITSLDHTIWFHAPFRADEWLLYDMESPRTGDGRGLSFGRIYTREGKLVMSTAQEGVIRTRDLTKSSKL